MRSSLRELLRAGRYLFWDVAWELRKVSLLEWVAVILAAASAALFIDALGGFR